MAAADKSAAGAVGLLNVNILKGLGDKLYDKRKNAALEIEKCGRPEGVVCLRSCGETSRRSRGPGH